MTITEVAITAAMERAATRLRAGGSTHCLPLMASYVDHVLAHFNAGVWVEVGAIVDPDRSHDWRVWLSVKNDDGRLRPWRRS